MERFRFSSVESSEELLAGLVDSYLEEQFIATKLFTCKDKEGTVWNVVAFDDEAEEIKPGWEQRFLDHLNDPISRCGV